VTPVRGSVITVAFFLSFASQGRAQQYNRPPVEGGFTEHLGQPRVWHRHAGAGAGFIFDPSGASLLTEARFGVYTDIVNPVFSVLGFESEIYAGARETAFDFGLRAEVMSPFLRTGAGFDLNGLDGKAYFLLSFTHPVVRGGILGSGSEVRLNYLPGRHNSFSLGIEVPTGRRIKMGRTRPRESAVHLDRAEVPAATDVQPAPALLAALEEMRESAQWISRLNGPFLEQDVFGNDASGSVDRELDEIHDHLTRADGRRFTPVDEVRRFHAALDSAFVIAAGAKAPEECACPETALFISAQARDVLLDEILIPYNRLLGQIKDPDTLSGLGVRARGVFVRWLHMDPRVPAERIDEILLVFTRVVDILEGVRRVQHEQWHDSRFVWLPLQLGLLPEQHDSQAEVDSLIERVAKVRFTDGNRAWYVVNDQFALQLSRTIHAARDYHVLWIHDIRGLDDRGDPDEMTYRHVLGAYLGALIERAKAYDTTGIFPVYMIFLDEYYYELNHSRMWMSLLQDPMHHVLELPRGYEAWADTIAAAQEELRRAVSGSRLLQDQARQYGDAWLRDLVSVHVSITNPADPSFWRSGTVPILGLPDNMARDHRKIAFFDVTEADPYRGGAIYTGAGVGEHYTTLNWEDRALVVEGPALLTLKKAARDLLATHGIQADRIPWSLRSQPIGPDYENRIRARIDSGGLDVRALEVHNQTGYSPKDLNVVKAVLYSMMPAGSIAIVPDALWSAGFWSGLLVGNALRGGRSLLIAPAYANAPSTVLGGMIRVREVVSRVVHANAVLHEPIEGNGGLLRVGVYSPTFEVTDLKGKLDALRLTLATQPWLRDLYHFQPQVYAAFDSFSVQMSRREPARPHNMVFEDGTVSKLHLKANFLASREAWDGLMQLPGWPAVLGDFIVKRSAQVEERERALARLEQPRPEVIDVGDRMIENWQAGLSAEQRERLVFYLMLGSQNQNYRSMVLDGEAGLLVSGTSINAAMIDLVSLTGQCLWIDDVRQLDRFYPGQGWLKLRIARWLRLLL
jgi:hypothetical protein